MKTVKTVSFSLGERVVQLVAEFAKKNQITKSAAASVLLTKGAEILNRDRENEEANNG